MIQEDNVKRLYTFLLKEQLDDGTPGFLFHDTHAGPNSQSLDRPLNERTVGGGSAGDQRPDVFGFFSQKEIADLPPLRWGCRQGISRFKRLKHPVA